MSRRANPTAIGLFVVGALILAVIGVGALGSSRLFESRTIFISYFDESVNGLDVGAPVKFKGVPIGEVTDIKLRVDMENETFQVPVLYAINLEPVTDTTGAPLNLNDPRRLREQIENGLRAQLQRESIVTGKLYVELTYLSDPDSVVHAEGRSSHLEIPTKLSPLAGASGLMAKLRQFDVAKINENLVTFLVNANEKINHLDTKEINRSILATIESVQEVVESDEVRQALRDVPELTEQLRATIEDTHRLVERVNDGVEPTAEELETTSEELRATLKEMRTTMEKVNETLSADSGMGYQIEEALSNLSKATEALRVLIRSLERNPGMLLRGREEPPSENQDE